LKKSSAGKLISFLDIILTERFLGKLLKNAIFGRKLP
jgi:hypothetical protein